MDEKVAEAMNCKYVTSSIYLDGEVKKLKYLGINSLQELIDILNVKSDKVIQFTRVFTNLYKISSTAGSGVGQVA